MTGRLAIVRDRTASTAAEFALVLPVLLIMLFGVIDGGRWLWAFNQTEKATQVGARYAAVTQIIPGGLAATYVGQTVGGVTLTQGDAVPAAALGKVTCQTTSGALGCTCVNSIVSCPGTINTAGWNAIVQRMHDMNPNISAANVVVEYRGSGLGYAGDPGGMDISPLVTVKAGLPATPLQFKPITTLLFTTFTLPTLGATLTAEDSLGNHSN